MSEEKTLAVSALDTSVTKGVITSNLRIVGMQLKTALEPYKGKEVTLENYKDAKASRADLNRMRKAFEQRRISLHKDYELPYEQWLDEYRKVLAEIDAVGVDLDRQIKAVEQKMADDKMKAVQELIDEALGKIQESEPEVVRIAEEARWFRLSQWSNATYALGTIQQDIDTQLETIRSALGMIHRSKHMAQLLARFRETGSASDLMRYDTELDAQDRQAETFRKDKEEAPAREAPAKEQAPAPEPEFDPYLVRIRKPENEKQKTVGVFTLEFTAPAYVVASIRDHLERTGCKVEVKGFKVKR